eukprot:1315966-Rhodomonas_salina.1
MQQRIEGKPGRDCKDLGEAWGRKTLARLGLASESDQLELASDSDKDFAEAKTQPSPGDPDSQVQPKGSLLEGVFSAEDLP